MRLWQAVKSKIVVVAVTRTLALISVSFVVLFSLLLVVQLFICLQLSSIVDFRLCLFHFSSTYFYPILWQLFLNALLRPKNFISLTIYHIDVYHIDVYHIDIGEYMYHIDIGE